MRRQLAGTGLCLGLAVALVPASLQAAPAPPAAPPAESPVQPVPEQVLETALEVLTEPAPGPPGEPPAGIAQAAPEQLPDATLVLRDLSLVLPRLTGADRRRAEALLARPTDGARDPYGDGYTVPSRRVCTRKLCVHWVSRTRDAPPNRRWVTKTRRVLGSVWRTEVGELGFRKPLPDGRRGGNRKLDVYLKEVGRFGYYGYCAPEPRRSGRRAPGYCVLDDDFARAQFGRPPRQTLRVTAAHEFLHAVQFGYDRREDGWLMEATSTWVEERFADGVDDNRQFLSAGQVGRPTLPLDSYTRNGFEQYGNWTFFEHLGERFGHGIVRRIWKQAGAARRDGRTYSVDAVVRALPDSTSFAEMWAGYAMGITTPEESWEEGAEWADLELDPFASTRTLGQDATRTNTPTLDHLASRAYRLLPADDLEPGAWRLRVAVEDPDAAPGAGRVAGVVRVLPDGGTERSRLPLDDLGAGETSVPFDPARTRAVHVVLGNASTRYRCGEDTTWACHGEPLDDGQRVRLRLAVVPEA